MTEDHAVIRGQKPASLVVQGGRAFLPRTREFQSFDVVMNGDRIVDIRSDAREAVGYSTTVIDAGGRLVVSGFIDVHAHLDAGQAFKKAHPGVLATGTTTIITELSRWAMICGLGAIEEFLRATAALPVSVYGTVPPNLFYDTYDIFPADDETAAEPFDLLQKERIVGTGEVRWDFLTE